MPKKTIVGYLYNQGKKTWEINTENNTVLKNLALFTNEGPCSSFQSLNNQELFKSA